MLRLVAILTLVLALGLLCGCTSGSPPPSFAPPLPLASRIRPPDPNKFTALEDVPWHEWKNPRVIVTSLGIVVLLPGRSSGCTVPPKRVGDVLQKTSSSDWPPGLVVMAKEGFADHEIGDRQSLERNVVELSKMLNSLGIHIAWGPPSP